MKTIHKHLLDFTKPRGQLIALHSGFLDGPRVNPRSIIHVGTDGQGRGALWIVGTQRPMKVGDVVVNLHVALVATGGIVPDNFTHLGTIVFHDVNEVWHVFAANNTLNLT